MENANIQALFEILHEAYARANGITIETIIILPSETNTSRKGEGN